MSMVMTFFMIHAVISIATADFFKTFFECYVPGSKTNPLDRTIEVTLCFIPTIVWYRMVCKVRLSPIRQISKPRFLMTT